MYKEVYFSNELTTRRVKKGTIVTTICDAPMEDWKTALAHDIKPIPAGTDLVVYDVLDNYYGRFIEAYFGRHLYYLDPKNLKYSELNTQV